jgi:hypothetical protein
MYASSAAWSVIRLQPPTPQTSTRVTSLATALAGKARARARTMATRMASRVHPVAPRGSRPPYNPYERPITSSMISSVPAPMRFRRMSRHTRSTPYSFMYPAPPWIWMHSSATSTAMRAA